MFIIKNFEKSAKNILIKHMKTKELISSITTTTGILMREISSMD